MSSLCALQKAISRNGRVAARCLVAGQRRVVVSTTTRTYNGRFVASSLPVSSSSSSSSLVDSPQHVCRSTTSMKRQLSSSTSTAAEHHSHHQTTHHHEAATTEEEDAAHDPHCALVKEKPDDVLARIGMTRDDVMKIAHQTPTQLRLSDMYKYASAPTPQDLQEQRLRNAQFLHKELPIRIAQRAAELLALPHGLSNTVAVQQVASTYISYLDKIQQFPVPQTPDDEERFTELLQSVVLDRTSVPVNLARGMAAWNESHSSLKEPVSNTSTSSHVQQEVDVEDALYRFFTARVGLRFLTEHFVLSAPRTHSRIAAGRIKALQNNIFPACDHPESDSDDSDEEESSDNVRGCIQSNIDLVKEVGKVADLVIKQTMDYYGQCPAIDIVDCVDDEDDAVEQDGPQDFCYVPNHLHYIMAELLKNSCRATVRQAQQQQALQQQQQDDDSDDNSNAPAASLPPIRVVIVKGHEDVTIKIADKGGGIPRSRMAKIWRFMHSTADATEQECDFGTDTATGAHIRGFGLPLARIYSRYFGGELTLKSMEGYGLDAYLHLPRLGDGGENLPLRVRSSPGAQTSLPTRLQSSTYSVWSPSRSFSTKSKSSTSSQGDKEQTAVSSKSSNDHDDEVHHTLWRDQAVTKRSQQQQQMSCFWEHGYYDPQDLLTRDNRLCLVQQQQEQQAKRRQYAANHSAAASSSASTRNSMGAA